MNAKQNLRIHTTYADGKDRPEELIFEALARGFDSIGFSEHTYLPYSSYPNQLTVDKMARYRQEIADLKVKYQGKINIFCGLEYDFYSEVDTEGFDYLIGSVHYLDCSGEIVTFDHSYVVPMVVGKLISGLCAVTLPLLIYRGDPQTSKTAVET